MANLRNWFTNFSDLWTAYNWVIGATSWVGISGTAGIGMQQLAAWAGASPLQAIFYGMVAAMITTTLGILYRLYQLNKPAALITVMPVYRDDSANQVGALNFIGFGAPIRVEIYCTTTEVVNPGQQSLYVPANRPGAMFTLSRTESQHLELVQYDSTGNLDLIRVCVPTKRPQTIVTKGDKFRLTIVAYAGMIKAQIRVVCWIERKRLCMEEDLV